MTVRRETWYQKIRRLWKTDEIHGVELAFDTVLLGLRYASVSYWLKDIWLNGFLNLR
jgi:hypothetical protein